MGFSELCLIFVVALIVFGPDKLPEFAKYVARAVREFRRMSGELQSSMHETVATLGDEASPAPSLKQLYSRIDPQRAIAELRVRPFSEPAPGSVQAPPAIDPHMAEVAAILDRARSEGAEPQSPPDDAVGDAIAGLGGSAGEPPSRTAPPGGAPTDAPGESAERASSKAEKIEQIELRADTG